MKSITCHILVIGGGPAGCAAAISAAKRGMNVLVVEQRAKIGVPVQCAEYIPALLVGKLNLGTGFVVQKVSQMRTILPDGTRTDMAAPGFMIHRDRFDQTLAREARNRGTEFLLSARAVERTEDGSVVVKERRTGKTVLVSPKIIIGADGPRSKTAQWCGVSKRVFLPAVQYQMALHSPMNRTEVYLSPDYYGGYAWLFPKGETANVGLGIKRQNGARSGLHTLLDEFVEKLKRDGRIKGRPLGSTGGSIPASPPESAVYGNILLAGDAAGHTHPITGAGIFAAVSAGKMAGRWAAEAISANNLEILKKYDHEWRFLFADTLNRAKERRQMMEREWNRFHQIIKSCWIGFREYYNE
ncbi:MAG: NAD(P)/FAD-dependent oxidoreductase [Deltaproteobacteria bacterium]|nr:NAD(P)/FAD-dependent oxidoreductase [Deltaproteobacteria bacterium]